MVSRVIPVNTFDLVIFGATGDLARRKLLPALFRRMVEGQMPPEARIVGVARKQMSRKKFAEFVQEALAEFEPAAQDNPKMLKAFLAALDYLVVDVMGDAGWPELKAMLRPDTVRAFYLSVGPSLFGEIATRLSQFGIATPESRIVVEKPLGHDLQSAKVLNAQLSACFDEQQVYRIDHYLGKETVQNLMAIRFANALFEPLWNGQHIDHVQLTVAESIGVEGRGEYYDKSGAMRDMVQNHMMQLLCLIAMEPPAKFNADFVRDEKLKVIRALEPLQVENTVRGQYRAAGDQSSYKEHAGNSASKTESFVALKVDVENWRWAGTPFYLRTGKRLRARMSEIAVVFKAPPHAIFPDMAKQSSNVLVIRLQPDEGITLHMTIKEPGPGGMRLTEVPLDMSFAEALGDDHHDADAYERLIMDVIRGDQTLFMRGDELEEAWAWVDPLIEAWSESAAKPSLYDAGGSGPEDALALMHRDGRKWREIES